ncbi:MAG: hypothetical protein GX478_00170 [Erysipelotrichaceae bacterium]|nr:hypothetical protein [Erysipelotrichaceae bacterium]
MFMHRTVTSGIPETLKMDEAVPLGMEQVTPLDNGGFIHLLLLSSIHILFTALLKKASITDADVFTSKPPYLDWRVAQNVGIS